MGAGCSSGPPARGRNDTVVRNASLSGNPLITCGSSQSGYPLTPPEKVHDGTARAADGHTQSPSLSETPKAAARPVSPRAGSPRNPTTVPQAFPDTPPPLQPCGLDAHPAATAPAALARQNAATAPTVVILAPTRQPRASAPMIYEPVMPARRPGSGSSRPSAHLMRLDSGTAAALPRAPDRTRDNRPRTGSLRSSGSSAGMPRVLLSNQEDSGIMMAAMSSHRGSLLAFSPHGERPSGVRRINSQVSFTGSEDGEVSTSCSLWRNSPNQNSIMVHESCLSQRASPGSQPLRPVAPPFSNKGFRKSHVDDDEISVTRVKSLLRRRRPGGSEGKDGGNSAQTPPSLPSGAQETSTDTEMPSHTSQRAPRRSPIVRYVEAPEVHGLKLDK